MFWKRDKTNGGELHLPGPKSMPSSVGRHLVLEEKKDPNWVWNLKGVLRPTEKKKAFYCRIFNEAQTMKAGIKVKDWTSLDDHRDLIIWEGYYDDQTNTVRREDFPKTSPLPS